MNDPRPSLYAGALATMNAGYLIVMLRIGWDPAQGKKKLEGGVPAGWEKGTNPTPEQVGAAINAGANGYFYRLPAGVFVADADTPAAREALTAILGAPDVVTGRGGAHWLTSEQLAPQPGIDTDPRQLYGPGSFYAGPDGVLRNYTGVVPAAPRPLDPRMPRKVAKSQRTPSSSQAGSSPGGALGEYLAQGALPPLSIPRAHARAAELLNEIATGPDNGAEGRMVINNAALFLGGLIGAGIIDHATAVERLEEACETKWGTCSEEDRRWIEAGLTDGLGKPVTVYDPAEAPSVQGPDDPWTAAGGPSGGAWYNPACDVVDQSLAESLARWMYPGARYDYRSGLYYQRHGLVPGQSDEDKRSIWRATDSKVNAPRTFVAQAARHLVPSNESPYYKLHSTSKTAGSIAAKFGDVVNLPGHYFAQGLADYPHLLWCAGVPWDLRTATVSELPLGTPHAQHGPIEPADVSTPVWDAWLSLVWPDPEVREWALRVLAVAFTGRSPSVVPILHGNPGSGKTVTVTTLMRLLSPEGREEEGYARDTGHPLIDTSTGSAHSEAVLNLRGRRLVYLDEGPPRTTRSEASHVEAFKRLTAGSGTLAVSGKYRSEVTFMPTHTLVMTTNNPPDLSDDGVLRRARVLPCPADPARTPELAARLEHAFNAEAPGILLGMIRRAALFLADPGSVDRSHEPLTVRERTRDLSDSSDMVAEWVRECTEPDEKGMKSSAVRDSFSVWRRNHAHWGGQRGMRDSEIYDRLDKLGYPVERRKDANYRLLRIRSTGGTAWAVAPSGGAGVEAPPSTEPSASTSASTFKTPGHAAQTEAGGRGGSTPINISPVTNPDNKINIPMGTNNRLEPPPPPPFHQPPRSVSASTSALADQPEPGSAIVCPWCGTPTATTQALKFRVHRTSLDRGALRCDGSQQLPPGVLTVRERKAKEREALKLAKIAAAAGPTLELPAAMTRGGVPRSVSPDEALAIGRAAIARNGGRIAADVETNARPLWHPEYEVQTIQLGDWAEAIDLDAADPAHRAVAATLIAEAAELEAYSYTADLVPLARLGVAEYADMLAKCIDVATIVKLTDPALTDNGDGLKETAKAVLGAAALSPAAEDARKAMGDAAGWIWQLKHDTPDERNGWLNVDKRSTAMVTYALADVLDCSALRLKLPQPDPAVMAREIVAERVVATLPYAGLLVDGEAVREQLSAREPRAAAKLARIRELGVENPDSPKQVTTRLTELGAILPQTKDGNDSGAKDVLEKLQHAPGELGELAKTIMEYRDDATVLKNMIRPWARSTEHGDSRTYPTIYTLGADTGRMSCVRPNLQQVAREGGLRECIAADPGHLFIAADFSSVEVRVAAYVSGDQNLTAMINGALTCGVCQASKTCVLHDLHAMIANQAYGPGFTKANRYNVKRVVFGRLYGGSAPTLAAQTGIPLEMVGRLIATLDALAPRLAAWSAEIRQAVKRGLREYRTYSGRVIHLDPRLPHKAPNYIIQGTARELLVDALVHWEAGPYAGGVVLPVHDEIVAMVRAQDAPAATAFLTRCMTTQLGPVPITVEADEPAAVWQSAA